MLKGTASTRLCHSWLHNSSSKPPSEPQHRTWCGFLHPSSIGESVIQIQPNLNYDEACLVEIRLQGTDLLLFGCFYRSQIPTSTSEQNNENLNRLFRCISKKKYRHKCLVGDFNFSSINWVSWNHP